MTGGHLDKTAHVWDLATGRPIGPPIVHPDRVMAVAFRPDGRVFATGCGDKTARLWDAMSGAPIGQPMENAHPVTALAFSPDGQALLTGCMDDFGTTGEARLWDVASGQPITPPLGHGQAITAIAFRPDGRAIAIGDSTMTVSGPGDGNVSIWSLPAPEPGDVEQLRRKIQVWTGLELQGADRFQPMTPEAWLARMQQLEAAGNGR